MSLAEKFDEIAMSYAPSQKFFILQDLQRAFYAGAEARESDHQEAVEILRALMEETILAGYPGGDRNQTLANVRKMRAEIDHFRSHK